MADRSSIALETQKQGQEKPPSNAMIAGIQCWTIKVLVVTLAAMAFVLDILASVAAIAGYNYTTFDSTAAGGNNSNLKESHKSTRLIA